MLTATSTSSPLASRTGQGICAWCRVLGFQKSRWGVALRGAYSDLCLGTYVFIHSYVCIYICVYVYIYISIYIYIYICTRISTYIQLYLYMYIDIFMIGTCEAWSLSGSDGNRMMGGGA